MPLKPGDRLPHVPLYLYQDGKPIEVSSTELLKQGKIILFAVPGAYTPTCSKAHLPGYVVHADAIKARGVDGIYCLSVNDAFVMDAWGREQNADGQVTMVSDGNADFARAMGLEVDLSDRGFGVRSQRYALIARDGVIEYLAVDAPGTFKVSGADALLEKL